MSAIEYKSLNEIVAYCNELQAQGESVPDEIYYAREVAEKLLAGKVDQACELREAVKARIEALSQAMSQANFLLDKLDDCFKQALEQTETKKLTGLAWTIRLQNNSKGTVVIEDESKIPLEMRRVEVSVSEKFSATDEESLNFWASVLLRQPVESIEALTDEQKDQLNKYVSVSPNRSEIEAILKKNPQGVPGAHLNKGTHVRIIKGAEKTIAVQS